MAAKKKASKKGKRDVLVVGSKVKDYVRSKGLMASGDLLEAISEKVHAMIDCAADRTTSNKRSTMRPNDL
ncbi:MAG: hypothetical protein V2A76_09215 [Planctomycetota bacterium]